MQTVNVLITKVIHHKTKTQQQHKCIWKKISEIVIRTFTKKLPSYTLAILHVILLT